MKAYLFTYSQACTQAQAHDLLNATNAVDTWVAPFPYAAILVSKLNTQELSAVIRTRLPGVWFMVTEVDGRNVDGWLPGDLWLYVNNPYQAWSNKLFEQLSAPRPELAGLGGADVDRRTGT